MDGIGAAENAIDSPRGWTQPRGKPRDEESELSHRPAKPPARRQEETVGSKSTSGYHLRPASRSRATDPASGPDQAGR